MSDIEDKAENQQTSAVLNGTTSRTMAEAERRGRGDMTEIGKQTLNAIRDSLVDAKSHIDKALETFDAKLYLASYANLNMGVAAGKVAQELCAIERNRESGG